MHLERIEIMGFKSFADKTVIEFNKGVTAIVGPNGSGKSNISEAVRWVLGEQSAKNLRGKRMNDIVFAGSQTRKQVNIAEVTLVLNNEDRSLPLDFTEVSLTRRINRNGDSDCFINKKPCRLKDLVDLLMDSGIGKDSFSMISQGKVEQIFQNKPEDRRSIFEDAAGVAKYKNRKVNAERKLTDTREHLNRVEDILHEINNQLAPLEKQRNTALSYKEKKKELSDIEIALIAVEIETLNEQWQLSKKEIHQYETQITELDGKQKNGQAELNSLKENSFGYTEELDALQEKIVAIVRKLEKLEGQKSILEQKADFSAKTKEDQEKMLHEKKERIEKEKEKRSLLMIENRNKQELRKELQEAVRTLKEKEKQFSQNKNEWIQQLRDDYIDKLQAQSTNKNMLQQLTKDQSQYSEQMESLKKKILAINVQLEETKIALNLQMTAIASHLKQIDTYSEEATRIQGTLEQDERLIQESTQNVLQLQKGIQQAEARKESQQELEDSYASYYQGVKAILKRRDAITGIRGPIGELFQVPDDYALAIDTALGSSVQHIVVDDAEAASKCIAILKRNQLGRATFLPLTAIKPRSMPSYLIHELESEAGFIGMAADLITVEEDYASIASNLLGTTIIAENLQSGLALAKVVQNRYRIVSLEGDVIHAGGSMTGGATKKQQGSSVFSRKNSIEKLTAYLDETKETYRKLDSQLQTKQTAFKENKDRLIFLQHELNNLRFALEKANEAKEREEIKQKTLSDERLADDYAAKSVTTYLAETEDKLEQERRLKATLAAQIETLKRDMDDSTLNEEERQKFLQKVQADLQAKQQELAIITEQEKQLRRDIQMSSDIIETETSTINAIQENLEEAAKLKNAEFQTIDEVNDSLATSQVEQQDLEKLLKEKRQAKKVLDDKISTEDLNLQNNQATLKVAWEELSKLENSAGRYEVAIDHHLKRLNEEYGLSYEAAKAEYWLSLSTEEASSKVKRLKIEIEALGPINLAAIGEYDRILERFTFLKEQQTDLLTAIETLTSTMVEMDQEVGIRFEKMFKLIKNQFELTFPKLFGGGKATIELTDPSNVLETGIEIVAQPPGKKLQQLSLLSGGEKAFTAIALLFSIIEVSPVPFCILDEVEAALDEANVVRFGKYLASFENQTQFIVITHRKGTMIEADALYGVTMQDSGVSRLASVKLEEHEEV